MFPVPSGTNPQVKASHYRFDQYVTSQRWRSYWHQIDAVVSAGCHDALCIGIGDNIVPTALELSGIKTSRFDLDPELSPDFSGDIRDIGTLVPPQSHDAVVCCQVLEHLPYEHFEHALADLVAIARRRVVISLPYRHKRFVDLRLKVPVIPEFSLSLVIPRFWKKWKFNGEHYWEVGTKGYSKRRVTRAIARYASITRTFHVPGNRYHLFYVLDKH